VQTATSCFLAVNTGVLLIGLLNIHINVDKRCLINVELQLVNVIFGLPCCTWQAENCYIYYYVLPINMFLYLSIYNSYEV